MLMPLRLPRRLRAMIDASYAAIMPCQDMLLMLLAMIFAADDMLPLLPQLRHDASHYAIIFAIFDAIAMPLMLPLADAS